ncbi:hypothetical protein CHS0354_034417 [Potamilus streckersoni]|uniref:Uncharacterized protein n=1 Tax=Potamilus streckersoni TaxID=2493646 RepID=A0AAE0S897_9BIVA|nr:hypothetical protein CHS0354_034417 [Potamilus streckersoni]
MDYDYGGGGDLYMIQTDTEFEVIRHKGYKNEFLIADYIMSICTNININSIRTPLRLPAQCLLEHQLKYPSFSLRLITRANKGKGNDYYPDNKHHEVSIKQSGGVTSCYQQTDTTGPIILMTVAADFLLAFPEYQLVVSEPFLHILWRRLNLV